MRLLQAFFATFCSLAAPALAAEAIERPDLEALFAAHGVDGAFAFFEPESDRLTLVNADRARRREIPASTFKIANSLIALETGAVADEDEVIPYGGKAQPVAAWAQDMSMRAAIRVSNVPVYQELARRIGVAAYEDWLARLSYGNGEVGEDVEHFWLKGPLRVSPVEQTAFLARLAAGTLPASARAQEIVRDILRAETRNGRMLYGKTGWTTAPDPDAGWYVGWVEHEERLTVFALVIDIRSRADADQRAPLAKRLLEALGVY